ncbi:Xaa-Pro dipeptidase [Congregibacter sp.]|uniref:Xaa-Pro dipeptidase n=1 Tax=Congregibacter sp. TaxID=2744308 RepID=UPI003F6A8342
MRINKLSTAALLSSLLACGALSVQAQAEQLLLSADHMVDTVSGKLIADPAVLITDGVIEAVGTRGKMTAPDGATEVYLEGKTLLPGFMDMHVHLDSSVGDVSFLEGRLQSVPRRTVNAVANANATLMAGFTSVRNVGSATYSVIAVRDAINAGDIAGPRVWAAGPALGITGGHCDDNYSPPELKQKSTGVADGPWAARAKVRENIKYGADTIKFCATGGVFSRGTKVGAIQYSLEEMEAIVDESHYRDLVVAAHAHGTEGIKAAIIAGVDSVEHASMLDKEAIELALEHGTYLSMDIYNTEYTLSMGRENGVPEENLSKEKQVGKVQRESFSAAVKAGVNMVFGTDAAIYPHGLNARQFSRMVEFGMTEAQALQAATVNAASLMKRDDLGAIREGYLADIVAVEGNPLEDISVTESVSFVMKDGIVFKNQ